MGDGRTARVKFSIVPKSPMWAWVGRYINERWYENEAVGFEEILAAPSYRTHSPRNGFDMMLVHVRQGKEKTGNPTKVFHSQGMKMRRMRVVLAEKD